MKKKLILFFASLSMATAIVGQDKSINSNKTIIGNIYTSLKPLDEQPAVFSSQADLDAKIQDKKNKTVQLISDNKNDPDLVKKYREQLWRFENAIVLKSK